MPSSADSTVRFSWIGALVLASGALNLAGEALWHRMASILVGDWALSATIVWSAFFLGSAIGAIFGKRLIRFLWLFEALPAIWSLAWAIAIRHGALELVISPWEMAAVMLPPAIAMGAHIPAYAALSNGRAARSWSLWHAGGAAGIFLLAALPSAVPLSVQLAGLAATQGLFALLLFKTLGRSPRGDYSAANGNRQSITSHATVMLVGFFAASWMAAALLQLSFLSLPLRMVGAAAIAASALAACLGGTIAASIPRRAAFLLPATAAALAALMIWISGWSAEWLLPQADPIIFGFIMLFLAFLLLLPLALTGAWYVVRAEQGDFGMILACAAIGNATGFIASYIWGMDIAWIAASIAALWTAIESRDRKLTKNSLASALVALAIALWLQPSIANSFHWPFRRDGIFELKNDWIANAQTDIHRVPPSWWSVVSIDQPGLRAAEISMHGASSHNMAGGSEFGSTLIGASYLPGEHATRTLVLGVLSGQTSAGAATFSDHVDAVDIAVTTLDAVAQLADWNLDVAHNPKVDFIIEDALNILKTCKPGSYDLIINGTSSPSIPAAGKMFADESVALASRCLKPNGVFVSFLSRAATKDLENGDLIVRPMARHFAQVDITLEPYPLLIGHNSGGTVDHQAAIHRILARNPDFANLAVRQAPSFFREIEGHIEMKPVRIIRAYQPRAGTPPTLDNGLAESTSVETYLRAISGAPFSTVSEELEALYDSQYRSQD